MNIYKINMIYNLSTILREIYNKNNNNNKNNIYNKNLKVNTELANQKSLELYEKYNTYRKARPISFFPVIKSTSYITDTETETETTIGIYIKKGLIIGGFFMLLACFPHYSYSYTYFKK